MTQQEIDLTGRKSSKQDVRLHWPDTYRPRCPICAQPTTGLLDHGRYVQRALQLQTVAEPCGCDVSAHAQTLQAAAIQAGAIF